MTALALNAYTQPAAAGAQLAAAAPGRDITPAMFAQYIAWIDRSAATARAYIINLRQFAAWLGFTGTRRPVRDDVLQYRAWLSSEHDAIQYTDGPAGWEYRRDRAGKTYKTTCRPNTIAQYLRSVCAFFKWTAGAGLYPDIAANIHAPKIRHDTHSKEALQPAEVAAIEDSIKQAAAARAGAARIARKDAAGRIQRTDEQGKRLYAMFLLATNAGLRTIEISRASVRDIVTRGGQTWLYIWGKGHTEPDQKKPIAPEVKAAIDDYLSSRSDRPTGTAPLFAATGNRSRGRRIAATTISTMLKKAMQAAGYDSERITAHSLRHTAGTAVQQLTGDIYATQLYMRHASPATTEIYLHNNTEKQESEIACRLYAYYHGAGNR